MSAAKSKPPELIREGINALLHSSLQLETDLPGSVDDQPVELGAVARRSVIEPLGDSIAHHPPPNRVRWTRVHLSASNTSQGEKTQ